MVVLCKQAVFTAIPAKPIRSNAADDVVAATAPCQPVVAVASLKAAATGERIVTAAAPKTPQLEARKPDRIIACLAPDADLR